MTTPSEGTPKAQFRAGRLLPALSDRTLPGESISDTAKWMVECYVSLIESAAQCNTSTDCHVVVLGLLCTDIARLEQTGAR